MKFVQCHFLRRRGAIQDSLGATASDNNAWFDTKIQFELTINTVDPFVIPWLALHVAQEQVAQSKAPIPVCVGQPFQPVGNGGVLRLPICLIAIAGLSLMLDAVQAGLMGILCRATATLAISRR